MVFFINGASYQSVPYQTHVQDTTRSQSFDLCRRFADSFKANAMGLNTIKEIFKQLKSLAGLK